LNQKKKILKLNDLPFSEGDTTENGKQSNSCTGCNADCKICKGVREMVILKCWHCDLNTGNRTCKKYPKKIPDDAWANCPHFKDIEPAKMKQRIKEKFPFDWDVPDEE